MHKGQVVVYAADPLLYGPMMIRGVSAFGSLVCEGFTETDEPTQIPGNTYKARVFHGNPEAFRPGELELWTVWQARIDEQVLQGTSS